MKYKGFYKSVNPKPKGEYIQLFVSDWNKDYWGFYGYIDKDNWETDIQDIQNLIKELNYRDGDVYVELIDTTEALLHFYDYIYDNNHYTHYDILNPKLWEIFEEKGDLHFLYFDKLNGSGDIEELENSEYSTYENWEEVLEIYNPELFKCLDDNNGLCCFDISHFYNHQGFTEIDDLIVSGGC